MEQQSSVISEEQYPLRTRWFIKAVLFLTLAKTRFGFWCVLVFYIFLTFIILITIFWGYGFFSQKVISLLSVLFLAGLYYGILILRIDRFQYSVEKESVALRQGFFSEEKKRVPYEVMQAILIKQDLFDKIFGLATLVIENIDHGDYIDTAKDLMMENMETPYFSNRKIQIPGLSKKDAEYLKEIILQKITESRSSIKPEITEIHIV